MRSIKVTFNTNLNATTISAHTRDNGYGWHKDLSQLAKMVFYGIATTQQCNEL